MDYWVFFEMDDLVKNYLQEENFNYSQQAIVLLKKVSHWLQLNPNTSFVKLYSFFGKSNNVELEWVRMKYAILFLAQIT